MIYLFQEKERGIKVAYLAKRTTTGDVKMFMYFSAGLYARHNLQHMIHYNKGTPEILVSRYCIHIPFGIYMEFM